MEGKKIVVGVVLLAVIIVAALITVKRTTSGPKPPDWVLDQKIDKIDMKSLEVITERLGDWTDKYGPNASGCYKNPKTGDYTMVDVMKCAACGASIPVPQMPAEARGKGMMDPAAMQKLHQDYKCPKCGKCPFAGPGGLPIGPGAPPSPPPPAPAPAHG